jgi:DNA repair protein RadC
MYQRAETAVRLAGVEACRDFMADCVEGAAGQATMWVAHLDAEARCIELASYPGGAEPACLPAGRIADRAAELGSAGLVLAQHRAKANVDEETMSAATRQLAQAAEAMGVTLVDHLLFKDRQCTSMRRIGLL